MSTTDPHYADPITPATRALPRLLCLHGGGVTAQVFFLQLRALRLALSPHFRCVCADGPFFCAPGPGILPVYAGMGPYRRWLRWIEGEHAHVGDAEAVEEIEYQMREAMEEDDARGGEGEWVGLLGFSQGGKVVASVLYESQLRLERARGGRRLIHGAGAGVSGVMELGDMPEGFAGARWKFAIVLAGRAPLVKLSELAAASTTMVSAGGVSEAGLEFEADANADRIVLPTLHVHGLQDQGLPLHRRLVEVYTAGDAVEVVEWDGGHRVPLKKSDIAMVTAAIMRTVKRAGVLTEE